MAASASGSQQRAGDIEMYTEIVGEGGDLVLLHGGMSSIPDLETLRSALAGWRRVIAPEQRGHGRTPDAGDELSYEVMASDTVTLLGGLGVTGVDLVGWSDGGILALTIATTRPDLVRRVVAIGANVSTEGAPPPVAAENTAWLATATSADLPGPPEDAGSPGGAEGWRRTADRILDMWRRGPALTLAGLDAVKAPVLYLSGDRDLVSLDHTVAMFRATPDAQLAVVPGADHDVPRTHTHQVAALIRAFLDGEDAGTEWGSASTEAVAG